MKRVLIAPHRMYSKGAKALAQGIGAKRTKATKWIKPGTIVVSWGRSDLQVRGKPYQVLNPSHIIQRATNKLTCLNRLAEFGVRGVQHTTSIDVVRRWLREPGTVIYGRRLLNASQGAGIVLIKTESEIIYCPLYTKGVLRAHEYRVHVFKDKILDVTKKRRRNITETSDYIKNLSNGWVYCRDNVIIPDSVTKLAKDAVRVLGLDFGAVDILLKQETPYVLEINTAPGLQGTTLNKYIEEFNKLKFL